MNFTKTVAVASVALGMALVSAAASAAVTFTLDSGTSNTGSSYGNTRASNGDDGPLGIQLTANAWSNTGGGAAATIESAYLSQYSGNGLGVCNRSEGICPSSPNHAVDNYGNVDSVLLSFNFTVNLAKISTGWVNQYGDSDFSVLYYTGGGSISGLTGTYANLLTSGWTLLGNYDGGSVQTGSTYNVGSGTQLSKYWLIMAYSGATTNYLDSGDDYFKIKSVVVNVPTPTQQSPEPATLALLGLGLAGIGLSRRRRK